MSLNIAPSMSLNHLAQHIAKLWRALESQPPHPPPSPAAAAASPPRLSLQQQSAPHCCPVGRLPGTDIFRDAVRFPQAVEVRPARARPEPPAAHRTACAAMLD